MSHARPHRGRAATVAILAALLGMTTAPLWPQATSSWAQEATERWYAAFHAGDAATLARLYVSDAVLLLPEQTVRGRAAIEAHEGAILAKARYSCTWAIESVQAVGRQAAVLGREVCLEAPKAGGAPTQVKSRWLTIFERQEDGSWLIARDATEDAVK